MRGALLDPADLIIVDEDIDALCLDEVVASKRGIEVEAHALDQRRVHDHDLLADPRRRDAELLEIVWALHGDYLMGASLVTDLNIEAFLP